MAIQDDIETLKTMQEDFRSQHGRYFEIIHNSNYVIPTEDDDLKIKELERFKASGDNISPLFDKINFTPTAKDCYFIIGNGTVLGDSPKRCYYMKGIRKNGTTFETEKVYVTDGDKEALDIEG